MIFICVLIIFYSLFLKNVNSYNNGVGKFPPMGWNPWSAFWCQVDCEKYPNDCISEKLFLEQIDLMVSLGLRDKGYEYFNFDDCWSSKERDKKTNQIQFDPKRFPNGVKYISDYLKERKMKFGMYGDIGTHTCGGYPGSEGYELIDIKTWVDWGVSYVKLDGCYYDVLKMKQGYGLFSKLLNESGVHILFSCSWPAYEKKHYDHIKYISEICNIWRYYDDISESWDKIEDIIEYTADNQEHFVPYAKHYSFNDPDMLILGHKNLSIYEKRSMLSIWCIITAPLIISDDLRTIDKKVLELYMNEEIIAINQDKLGIQGKRLFKKKTTEIWGKSLYKADTYAIGLFNKDDKQRNITVEWNLLKLEGKYNVRDLFEKKNIGVFEREFSSIVMPHDTVFIKIEKIK